MWNQRKSREWQVGDVVHYYGAHSRRSVPDSTHTIKKVYKNGNFIIEKKNYIGESYTVQFSGKHSDGYYAHGTGEGFSRPMVCYADEEQVAKVEEARFAIRKQQVAKFVGEEVVQRTKRNASNPLSADQLARITAILNEAS